jgi:hypothetical protein
VATRLDGKSSASYLIKHDKIVRLGQARLAAVFYLIGGLTFQFAEGFVRGKLVVHGDAAATANNILTHETLFRLGFAAELIETVTFIAVTLLFYNLFSPVNRSLSLLAAFFSLVACTIQAISCLFSLATLDLLGGTPYLSGFKVEHLQAVALLSLVLRAQTFNIGMVLFGIYNMLLGYLIFKSKFLPRVLGVFLAFAGLTYQAFLSPPLADHLFPYLLAPAGALGELSLVFWLLVFAVNVQQWKEQASGAGVYPLIKPAV